MKDILIGIVVAVVLFFSGMAVDRYVVGIECEQVGSDTTYINIPVIKDSVIIVPEYIVREVPIPFNQDSLWLVAKKYWKEYYEDDDIFLPVEYIAKIDTSFQDSLVSIDVGFVSPMLLHPDSYFQFDNITIRHPKITTTVMRSLTFWDRIIPTPSIQVGFGYGVIHKHLDLYVGAGLSWEIK